MSEPNDVVYQRQGGPRVPVAHLSTWWAWPMPDRRRRAWWRLAHRRPPPERREACSHGRRRHTGRSAALDFRQSQDAPYPASILDINLGVRWVKANAHRFDGSPRIGGLGSSSGGHQILLTAMRPYDERYTPVPLHDEPDVDVSLAFVVACWPVSDPLAAAAGSR